MFDSIPSDLDTALVRPLVLAQDGAAGLADMLGASAVVLVSPKNLAADWPDYVVARARTGGALVAEGVRESAVFMRLAEGRLMGRSAVAGLISGSLVFLMSDPEIAQKAA